METVTDFFFLGSKMTADGDCSYEIKTLAPWKKSHAQPRQHIKKQTHYFANKGLYSQSYGFSSRHVWMWELDRIEGWAPKNWCFWTVMLEKIFESPLDQTRVHTDQTKGNQSWIFIGRTDAEAEAPILWPPDVKTWLTGKDPHAGKDWRQEEMGTTEDEIVGWHHQLNGWVLALQEMVKNREAWHATVHGVAKSRTWLSDWTTTTKIWKKKEQQQPRREAVAATQSGTWGRWKGECSRADAEEQGGLPPTAKPCGHT